MKKSELVQLVVERTGISQGQAESAVNLVLQQLKAKLPAPIATQMDNFLEGGEGGGLNLGDIAKQAGGLFGQ